MKMLEGMHAYPLQLFAEVFFNILYSTFIQQQHPLLQQLQLQQAHAA